MIKDENKEPKVLNLLFDFFYQNKDNFKIVGILRKTTSILEDN